MKWRSGITGELEKEPSKPSLERQVVPDHRALRHPPGGAGALSCSSAVSEYVYGAVGAPLLDGQRRVVQKARALSHYSGDAF